MTGYSQSSDITVDVGTSKIDIHRSEALPWRISLIDTGELTMTGGRLKRVKSFVEADDCFCLTYGDGLSNVNITELIAFHKAQNVKATLTATFPPGRFGALTLNGDKVTRFQEKPEGDGSMVNSGFFVMSPSVIDYIDDDTSVLEAAPLEALARDNQLAAYRHTGFWQPMDTLRDKVKLEDMWASGTPPWKVWS